MGENNLPCVLSFLIKNNSMIVRRNKYFSEEKKEKKKRELTPAQLGLVAAGTLIGGKAITDKANRITYNNALNSFDKNTSKNAKSVTKKIIEEARSKGIKFRNIEGGEIDMGGSPAGYLGVPFSRMARKAIKILRKKDPNIREGIDEEIRNNNLNFVGKDMVVVKKGAQLAPDMIGHEVGHAYNCVKGRESSPVGRVAHNLMPIYKLSNPLAMGLHGMRQGYKRERDKARGKKSGFWTKHGAVVLPAALNAPALISEAAASSRALKLMKKHGADKDTLNLGKKNLLNAFGSHLSVKSVPVVAGLSGHYLGRAIGKYRFKDNNKNSNKKKKDDSEKK